jgi:hypothetical protein
MKHTPEPWRPGKHSTDVVADIQPEDAGASGHADVDYYGGYLIAESIRKVADRERIIACVNTLHGFPTRELERGIVADMKAALVTKDPKLIDLVSERLRTILTQVEDKPHASYGIPEGPQ